MKIFVAASYSAHVDYETGNVHPEYKEWLEATLSTVESLGHTVFCALRADGYKINNDDPASAFRLDMQHIKESDTLLALLAHNVSAGVQTEIGVALALGRTVFLAHEPDQPLTYFNAAMVQGGAAQEIVLPAGREDIQQTLANHIGIVA
ncbi:MAG TPA: nucleoside 2-deoxyribosyltransferase [Candidatus Saccharimonadales bacterium]|nr:nucleoside 2-deoxyribosyltransferase [Candidatus Saccharimonadales bacterium]